MSSTHMWAQVNALLEYTQRLKEGSNYHSCVFTRWRGGNHSSKQYGFATRTPQGLFILCWAFRLVQKMLMIPAHTDL